MQEGWNGLDLGKALETEAKTISGGLPLGISLEQGHGSGGQHPEAVDEFMLKFFVALGVVLVVSLLSLGWRVGIVVAAPASKFPSSYLTLRTRRSKAIRAATPAARRLRGRC